MRIGSPIMITAHGVTIWIQVVRGTSSTILVGRTMNDRSYNTVSGMGCPRLILGHSMGMRCMWNNSV